MKMILPILGVAHSVIFGLVLGLVLVILGIVLLLFCIPIKKTERYVPTIRVSANIVTSGEDEKKDYFKNCKEVPLCAVPSGCDVYVNYAISIKSRVPIDLFYDKIIYASIEYPAGFELTDYSVIIIDNENASRQVGKKCLRFSVIASHKPIKSEIQFKLPISKNTEPDRYIFNFSFVENENTKKDNKNQQNNDNDNKTEDSKDVHSVFNRHITLTTIANQKD